MKHIETRDIMDRIKLLGIAPYEGMKDLMENIAIRRGEVELTAYVGDLEEGLRIALRHQDEGFAGIVSRGGTAELLRRSVSLPVAEIPLSVYDVLRAIRMAQNYDGRWAIVGFPSITKCSRQLCDLLQYEAHIETIEGAEDVASRLEELKARGFSLVLGDAVTVTSAKRLGINGILITSGVESIEEAFDHAVELCRGYEKRQERVDFLGCVLGALDVEVLVLDGDKKPVYRTPDDFPDDLLVYLQKNVDPVRSQRLFLPYGDGSVISASLRHCQIGGAAHHVFSLRRMGNRNFYDGQGVSFFNRADILGDVDSFFSKSNFVGKMSAAIEDFAGTDFPVLIVGEEGTGKLKTAKTLYVKSRFADNPLIVVDCHAVAEKKWRQLLDSEESPLWDEGLTVFFRGIGALDDPTAKRLIALFESMEKPLHNRLLFSFTAGAGADPDCPLCHYLKDELRCLIVNLPPLRQRPSDIRSLSSLYINELNVLTGKQVIGLSEEAMGVFQNYRWERNLDQMKRVLGELVVITDAPYISAEDVRAVLEFERSSSTASGPRCEVDLSRPFGEITKQVFQHVLREENMNQSRAARRLGVGRSTLWRVLREG